MSGFVQGAGEEVKGSSPYKEFKFENVGEKITCMMVGTETRNSSEWGEFKVLTCVKFPEDAKSIEEAVKAAELRSFALPTVLLNQVTNGLIVPNECYTIEFVLDKGDKYIDKKTNKQARSKAKHFKVLRLSVPQEGIVALNKLVPNKMIVNAAPVASYDDTEEAPAVGQVRV